MSLSDEATGRENLKIWLKIGEGRNKKDIEERKMLTFVSMTVKGFTFSITKTRVATSSDDCMSCRCRSASFSESIWQMVIVEIIPQTKKQEEIDADLRQHDSKSATVLNPQRKGRCG